MSYNIWKNIIVQERARLALQKIYTRKQFPSAVIFLGSKGVGKEAHAFAFAQSINCVKNDFEPCGECQRCRNVFNFISPDVYLIYSSPTSQIERNKAYRKVELLLEKKKLIPTLS
ncbi:MAG: hypothetical protein ACPL25_04570 [Ignavibacteria bacterium]